MYCSDLFCAYAGAAVQKGPTWTSYVPPWNFSQGWFHHASLGCQSWQKGRFAPFANELWCGEADEELVNVTTVARRTCVSTCLVSKQIPWTRTARCSCENQKTLAVIWLFKELIVWWCSKHASERPISLFQWRKWGKDVVFTPVSSLCGRKSRTFLLLGQLC